MEFITNTQKQWLGTNELSDKFVNGTLKLTTFQAFQLDGVLKVNLRQIMKEINDTLLDTLAAFGDVNRNVMSPVNPFESELHAQALGLAHDIHDHLNPSTCAYAGIWLDGEKTSIGQNGVESRSMLSLICRESSRLRALYLREIMWMFIPTV